MASSSEANERRAVSLFTSPSHVNLARTGMQRRLERGQAVVLQHVQEGLGSVRVSLGDTARMSGQTYRLAGIVETEEQNLRVLVQQTCRACVSGAAANESGGYAPSCARTSQNQLMMNIVKKQGAETLRSWW